MSNTRCLIALDKAGERLVTADLRLRLSSRIARLGAAAGLELTTCMITGLGRNCWSASARIAASWLGVGGQVTVRNLTGLS